MGEEKEVVRQVAPGNAREMILAAQEELQRSNVRIVFSDGLYEDKLNFSGIGHSQNTLILEGQSSSAVLLSLSTTENSTGTLDFAAGCQNIVVRNLHFRAKRPKVEERTNPFGVQRSKDIRVESCTWQDIPINQSAAGVSESERVSFHRCKFTRTMGALGSSGAHAIYLSGNAGSVSRVNVWDCEFYDHFGGSVIKMKLRPIYISVVGCSFARSEARLVSDDVGPIPADYKFVHIHQDQDTPDMYGSNIFCAYNKFINYDPGNRASAFWINGWPTDSSFTSNLAFGKFDGNSINPVQNP